MNFPPELHYTKDHEWIRLEGADKAVVGITDFAQKELEAGSVFGTVEAVKTVSDLYLPINGTVEELNPALANAPELVNNDPYGEGWMVRMTISRNADIKTLMDAKAYEQLVGQ